MSPETDIRIKKCLNGWLVYRTGGDHPLWVATERRGDLSHLIGELTDTGKEEMSAEEAFHLININKNREGGVYG